MAGPGLRLPSAPEREPEYGHDALVVCDNLVRIYQSEGIELQALRGLDLLVHDGEMIAIVGASGSGKSTLLQVLAGVDAPTAGKAGVAGHDLLTGVAVGIGTAWATFGSHGLEEVTGQSETPQLVVPLWTWLAALALVLVTLLLAARQSSRLRTTILAQLLRTGDSR